MANTYKGVAWDKLEDGKKACTYKNPVIRKTGFSNFKERTTTDFAEIQRLEAKRIDRELGIGDEGGDGG